MEERCAVLAALSQASAEGLLSGERPRLGGLMSRPISRLGSACRHRQQSGWRPLTSRPAASARLRLCLEPSPADAPSSPLAEPPLEQSFASTPWLCASHLEVGPGKEAESQCAGCLKLMPCVAQRPSSSACLGCRLVPFHVSATPDLSCVWGLLLNVSLDGAAGSG